MFAAQASAFAVAASRRTFSATAAFRPQLKAAYSLPQDLLPTKVGPKWRGARISGRQAAVMRKMAVLDGSHGTYDEATGALLCFIFRFSHPLDIVCAGRGWKPEWDKQPKSMVARPPKGKRHSRVQADR